MFTTIITILVNARFRPIEMKNLMKTVIKPTIKIALFSVLSFVLPVLGMSVATAAEQQLDSSNIPQNNFTAQGNSASTVKTAAISKRKASDLARENFKGRVLNIRLETNFWRVRMDQEGTVFNVYVNASSGEVSRPSE